MMTFWRRLIFSGLIIFAITFFLPPEFYNSPLGRFRWSFDSIFLAESPGESLAFLGICLVIAYPYIWALITAFFLLGRFPVRWAVRSQFICHLLGGIPLALLGLTLILLQAEFPPPRVQWIAVLAPAIFIIFLLAATKLVKISRRLFVLVVLALFLFIPLQFTTHYYVQLDGGAGWGYLMGGLSALVGLIAGCALIFTEKN